MTCNSKSAEKRGAIFWDMILRVQGVPKSYSMTWSKLEHFQNSHFNFGNLKKIELFSVAKIRPKNV